MTRIPTRKPFLHRREIDRARLADKLVERWLFERSAVTAYELAAPRLRGVPELASLSERLDDFTRQERLHMEMLEQLLRELGRAPREMPATPSVNIAATEAEGLLELLRGAELHPDHVLEVLLAAEVLDGAGWELLIALATEADLDEEWLRSFRAAAREEAEHRHVIRTHLEAAERRSLYAHAPAP